MLSVIFTDVKEMNLLKLRLPIMGIAAMALYWILSIFVLSLSRIREYYADLHVVKTVYGGARKLSED